MVIPDRLWKPTVNRLWLLALAALLACSPARLLVDPLPLPPKAAVSWPRPVLIDCETVPGQAEPTQSPFGPRDQSLFAYALQQELIYRGLFMDVLRVGEVPFAEVGISLKFLSTLHRNNHSYQVVLHLVIRDGTHKVSKEIEVDTKEISNSLTDQYLGISRVNEALMAKALETVNQWIQGHPPATSVGPVPEIVIPDPAPRK